MKKIPFILLLTLVNFRSSRGELQVISTDQYSVILEYSMEEPEIITNQSGDKIVNLPGCHLSGQPGAPGILEYSAKLGVPEGAKIKVEFLSINYIDQQGFELAPIPTLTSSNQAGLGAYIYTKSPEYYKTAGFYPISPVKAGQAYRIRQYNVADIKITPLQFDPIAGILRLYKNIRVKISWGSPVYETSISSDPTYEPVFSKLLLNYPLCKDLKIVPEALIAKATDPFAETPVWYRMSLLKEGIYCLDYDYLERNGIDPKVIDPRTIKIYSGGSSALPKDGSAVVPDTMPQLALWVRGQDDGRFDESDCIIFYGQDLSGWNKNSLLKSPQYFNPYCDTNCYWLAWGGENGLRMAVRNCDPGQEYLPTPQYFKDTLHFEQDKFNPFNSGEFYYWINMRRSSTENIKRYSFDFLTPGNWGSGAEIKLTVHAGIYSKHRFIWGANGKNVEELLWTGGPLTGTVEDALIKYEISDSAALSGLYDGINTLTIDLLKENADSSDAIYFNWLEAAYFRKYQAFNGQLKFRADSTGDYRNRFYITGLNSDSSLILDISNPDVPAFIMSSKVYQAYVQFDDSWAKNNRYFAASPSAWLKPFRTEAYYPNNLRQTCSGVKYLIIAADQFWPQAQALLAHHKTKPERQPALAVKLSWVYNEFGFGLRDPAAIRNFLKYIYLSSGGTSPAWCLLFGNGNYDYRHIDKSISDANYIPTHQEDILNFVLSEYQLHSFDDWYAYCVSNSYPQFAIARLPVANNEEAWTVVSKAVKYDSPKTYGPWRSETVLVADDLTPDGSIHMSACENLYDRMPGYYNVEKVYGVQYLLEGDHKPSARADLIEYWNKGSGIVNFVGHGAWWTWGHEWYFRDTDVPYLGNDDKLPFVITASCGISRFDNPYYKCINSLVVTKPNGGAIASFGSTREGYSFNNNRLNYNLYISLYDSLLDLGRSAYMAKILSMDPDNNQCYTLLGDPGVKFSRPQNNIDVKINADTLYEQGKYIISGKVNFFESSVGSVNIKLFDIPKENTDYNYFLLGNVLYQATLPAVNDSFTAVVNIPQQLRTGSVPGARASAYAWNSTEDAAGVTADTIYIGGIDPDPDTTVFDTSGPKIELYSGGKLVKEGDFIAAEADFTARISDQSGINIVPGVSLYGEIKFSVYQNNILKGSEDISQSFVYNLSSDTLSAGTAGFNYNFGSSGDYKIKIEAYDTKLLKGLWENEIKVETDMSLASVYNYPNPFSKDTYFTFMLSRPADVEIRIFTVAGNLIRQLTASSKTAGYNQVYWDGRDDRGSSLANGVYLYKITAKSDGQDKSEFGKLVVIK